MKNEVYSSGKTEFFLLFSGFSESAEGNLFVDGTGWAERAFVERQAGDGERNVLDFDGVQADGTEVDASAQRDVGAEGLVVEGDADIPCSTVDILSKGEQGVVALGGAEHRSGFALSEETEPAEFQYERVVFLSNFLKDTQEGIGLGECDVTEEGNRHVVHVRCGERAVALGFELGGQA